MSFSAQQQALAPDPYRGAFSEHALRLSLGAYEGREFGPEIVQSLARPTTHSERAFSTSPLRGDLRRWGRAFLTLIWVARGAVNRQAQRPAGSQASAFFSGVQLYQLASNGLLALTSSQIRASSDSSEPDFSSPTIPR